MRVKGMAGAVVAASALAGCATGIGQNQAAQLSPPFASTISCESGSDLFREGQQVSILCRSPVALTGADQPQLHLMQVEAGEGPGRVVAVVDWPAGAREARVDWTPGPSESASAYALIAAAAGKAPAMQPDAVKFVLRVLRGDQLSRFEIERHETEGGALFTLSGGMSAEYAIEKAVSGLAGAMSHSWRVSRAGNGPRPVFAHKAFLRESVKETVALYDRELGADRPFDTVILSTGYPSVPYLSQALNAPVLPLHFLASADSVAEIRNVLDGAEEQGYSAYATLGHDPSVDHAVAWIKLLDLPPEYRDFLVRHQVRNVLISGSTGVRSGETSARNFASGGRVTYDPGDLYLMYPGTSDSDEESLAQTLADLPLQTGLSDFVRITDWESGVAPSQVCRIARSIDTQTSGATEAYALAPEELSDLYDLATSVTVALMAKNRALYPDPGQPASGIVLNPYLMAYPGHEFRDGYIPIVYFQVVPAEVTLGKIDHILAPALARYFPDRSAGDLRIWVNSSRNFGARFFGELYEAEIARRGFSQVKVNDYEVDEQWDPSDPTRSMSEIMAEEEADRAEGDRLKAWNLRRQPLTLEEFKEALTLHPEVELRDLNGCVKDAEGR